MTTLTYFTKLREAAFLVTIIFLFSCQPDYSSSQSHFGKTFVSVWNGSDVNGLDDILSEDFVRATPTGDIIGLDSLKSNISAFRQTFPDAKISVNEEIHTKDRIAVSWSWSGTNQLLGKKVDLSGLSMVYIEDGKMVKELVHFDNASLTTQLGGKLSPPSPVGPDDAIIKDPDHYKVLFENEDVRAIWINYGPGETSVEHTHRKGVLLTPPGEAGDDWTASWYGLTRHNPRNDATSADQRLYVEVK